MILSLLKNMCLQKYGKLFSKLFLWLSQVSGIMDDTNLLVYAFAYPQLKNKDILSEKNNIHTYVYIYFSRPTTP